MATKNKLASAAQVLLLSASLTLICFVSKDRTAIAQEMRSASKVASLITVRIDSATQGSGVIIERTGNTYTVVTAWHVIQYIKKGEEAEVMTYDGQSHKAIINSINQVNNLDMGYLKFVSKKDYPVPLTGDVKTLYRTSAIYTAGFPNSMPQKLLITKGVLESTNEAGQADGYDILYTNETEEGMSGGPIIASDGKLYGIHGLGMLDLSRSNESIALKTGINQGIAISHFFNLKKNASSYGITKNNVNTNQFDQWLIQARHMLSRNKYSEAKAFAEKSLKSQKTSFGYYYLGTSLIGLNQYNQAIQNFDIALMLNTKSNNVVGKSEIYANKCQALIELRLLDEAINSCENAISINPNNAEALSNIGKVYFLKGNYSEALAYMKKASSIGLKDAASYWNLCTMQIQLVQLDSARESCMKSIELDPSLQQPYSGMAQIFYLEKDFNKALYYYNESLSKYQSNSTTEKEVLYFNMGLAYSSLKRREESIASFTKAININPKYGDAYAARGSEKGAAKDFVGACNDLRSAVQLGESYFLGKENFYNATKLYNGNCNLKYLAN